ncbi:hypothetical protein B0H63DRAFT_533434 [Podospora didyma]|uniref:Tc toxin complex TcA C-terminal TcB-binding domain-containing protein n=1 Tax=Podospora didyma TaxID=330526 RepID=A0AAE0U904_9PEZI|nr:hypothetical protein B0H63DRAFT_533434 [Podospora didyma]
MRTLVADRLFKARNNLDINGRPIIYAMSEPAIDPAAMMNALPGGGGAANNGLASLVNDADCPMPYQRFSVLLGKALELCNEVRSMGEQFLAALEKQDAEALAMLKARQDSTRQKMVIDVKALQRAEIIKTIESLQQTRDAVVAHLNYLLRLTGDPLDPGEIISAGVAAGLKTAADAMELTVGLLRAVPEVTAIAQPLGCGVSVKADAANASRRMKGIRGSVEIGSSLASVASIAFARVGALTRQLQERRMQANAKDPNAVETETWYRSKYTNDRLCAWLEGQLRALHFDLYGLAADICRRAERAFRFGRGDRIPGHFLRAGGYWNSSRVGLLAAQQLMLDLRYMRRLRSVAVSIPPHRRRRHIEDTGTFDLAFGGAGDGGGRYGPFEGAGAVSSWRLEMPPSAVRPFDYSTISDVVLHLWYTAVDGGPGSLEARNDLACEWSTFASVLSRTAAACTASLDLSGALATRLPFWARPGDVRIENFTVAVTSSDS